jgi:hypothetical protein
MPHALVLLNSLAHLNLKVVACAELPAALNCILVDVGYATGSFSISTTKVKIQLLFQAPHSEHKQLT